MGTLQICRRAAVLLLGAFLIAPAATPLQKKQSSPKKTQDAFVNGAPFSFEQVLFFVRQNAIPPKRQKEAIQHRGLDFSLSPEDFDKLKAAGASDDMLQLIKEHARPAPPPVVKAPPPAPKVGDLNVNCEPAECEVSVGGVPKGPTRAGVLQLSGLRPGPTAIDFNRVGYVGSQALVTIEAGKTSSAKVMLEPDRQTKEAFGEALYRKMVDALGGEAAIQESLFFQAEGSATIWARDGAATRWSLAVRAKPDRALLQVQGGGGIFHELAFLDSQFKTSKGLKGNDARELPEDFGILRDHQLARLIALLSAPKFKMVANRDAPAAGQDLALTAEGSTQTITIGLDNDLRPAQVKFGTATGLGSEIVTYSDYVKKGKMYYPTSMQVRPDATPRGIQVHFDRIELAPKLKDTDYNLKGKPVPSLSR
jgi:hypothetical protein